MIMDKIGSNWTMHPVTSNPVTFRPVTLASSKTWRKRGPKLKSDAKWPTHGSLFDQGGPQLASHFPLSREALLAVALARWNPSKSMAAKKVGGFHFISWLDQLDHPEISFPLFIPKLLEGDDAPNSGDAEGVPLPLSILADGSRARSGEVDMVEFCSADTPFHDVVLLFFGMNLG